MRLNSFQTDTFAGIKNRQVSFQEGLNVILGPNEAGKSTMIEAIFATIFKEAKLRMNLGADKEFKQKFMPYPDGDYINGSLEFIVDDKQYKLKKEWGENHSIVLELPDGQLLKSSKKIEAYLKELFAFGQATYGNVVFARQLEVKEAVKKIVTDNSIINTVSAFLRKAVMELEGISVEKLKNKIDQELNELIKRWDLENNRSDNPNRDINNPYKVGYGKIYEAYINKAGTELKMEQAREIEEKFKQFSAELKDLKEKRETIAAEINEMAKIEDDIFNRGRLEPEIKRLQEKSDTLKRLNRQWPLKEDKLNRKREELEKLNKNMQELIEEKKKAIKKVDLEKVKVLLNKVDTLKDKIKEKKEEQIKITRITADDIKELERLDRIIKKNEAFLEASTLIAKIYKSEGQVIVNRGVEDQESYSAGAEFKANGYLHIKVADLLEIEIQSGEINFTVVKEEYQQGKAALKKLLDNLKVEKISEARFNKEKYTSVRNEINNLEQQINNLLDGRNYNKLMEEIDSLMEIDSVRDIDLIEKELEKLNSDRTELIAEGRSIRDQIKSWQNEYGEVDNILDRLVEIKTELKGHQDELSERAQLPDGFKTAEDFKNQLSSLREKSENIADTFHEKKVVLAEITSELPDESYEELVLIQREYERKYKRLVKRAHDLLKIQEVIERKLSELDDNTFQPLAKSFDKYLSILTADKYQLGDLDDDFRLEIINTNNKNLPVDINFLSYGTYDGVALAFRFALIEQLFIDKDGFIILDDCLVNLDPERKERAIELINKFSDEFQVIFTTCNPETARELGGNLIELSA